MPTRFARQVACWAIAATIVCGHAVQAGERLKMNGDRGTIDFAIGDSRVFRTTGGFKEWQGIVHVVDEDIPQSKVEVIVRTGSVQMLDNQQTAMLKEADFFHVEKFPEMAFRSTRVERTGETTLRVDGDITLRGITRPMTLEVSVTGRRPHAATGSSYAGFRAKGTIKRSEFGMTKFVDIVGDDVEITIDADALR